MTAHAEAEHEDHTGHAGPPRGPAMRAYCASLTHFTSSVHSSELALRHDEAATVEQREELETASGSRLRGIDKAGAEAAAAAEHVVAVRERHGIGPADTGASAPVPDPRAMGADLGAALASLARRRDQLRTAEAEFDTWRRAADRTALRVVVAIAGVLGTVGALVLAASAASSTTTIVALLAGTAVVTGAALLAAVVLRLPQVCAGPSLARSPDPAAVSRFGALVAAVAIVGLALVSVLTTAV
ncbi:hypothetical protein CLV30_11489 [Haloactinopolyspora alba]|uniref:Uncharacterized protein n=1 Tax=Haloactinopolyspora alba TaxID=648780 RepID=A0A2P8DVW5_9ACTN|nr:hypothetical protein [Haloactinopolyspora alba]PSL01359.1 hypothetical protein CLV30_11489 [Haloactinopolyspora alba]